MPLYRPSELSKFLASLERGAKRTLSQNFLIDGNIVQKIMEGASLQEGDVVLEIGPGPGVLTEALLEKGVQVIAIEKDHDFAEKLIRLDPEGKRLVVVEGDVLDVSFEEILRGFTKRAKVISNLPYHITTPILEKIAHAMPLFERAVLMMQDEVADKILKGKGSLLSHLIAACSKVSSLCKVQRGSFSPKPKVVSTVLLIQSKKPSCDLDLFSKFLKNVFSMKRKTVQTSLKKFHDPKIVQEALLKAGISLNARVEELSHEQLIHLYARLSDALLHAFPLE